jgi:hypothetical protein
MSTDLLPISSQAMPDRPIWVKVRDQGKWPQLKAIVEEAISSFDDKGWPSQALAEIRDYLAGQGKLEIGLEINRLTREQLAVYIETAEEILKGHCSRAGWRNGEPAPSFIDTINSALVKFREHRWNPAPLLNIRSHIERVNRLISSRLELYDAKQQAEYSAAVTRVFAGTCGFGQFTPPLTTRTQFAKKIAAGQEATLTVSGNKLSPFLTFAFVKEDGTGDQKLSAQLLFLSADKKTATIRVKAEPDGEPGLRTIMVGSTKQEVLTGIQADPLEIVPANDLVEPPETAARLPQISNRSSVGARPFFRSFSGAAPGEQVWIKVQEPDELPPKLPPLEDLLEQAIKSFERKGWSSQALTDIRNYVVSQGNLVIGRELNRLTLEQQKAYLDAAKKVFNEHCDQVKGHSEPVYPSIFETIDRTLIKFKEQDWNTAPLLNIRNYIETRVNRLIYSGISSYSVTQRAEYSATAARFLAATCGYGRFTVPLISRVNPSKLLAAGQETAITITGSELPAELTVAFLKEDGTADLNLRMIAQPFVSADKKTATIGVIASQEAEPGLRTVLIGSAEHEELPGVLADTLEITGMVEPGQTPLTEDENGERQKADHLVNILKAGGNLALGASTYPSASRNVRDGMRAAGDVLLPNLKLKFNLGTPDEPVTIVGEGSAIVPKTSPVELLGDLRAGVQDTIHDSQSSYLLSAGLGLDLRVKIQEGRRFFFDLRNDLVINSSNYRDPNKFFYNGLAEQWTLGIGVNSNFQTDWLLGRAFVEREFTSFSWDNTTYPGGFDGQTEKWRTGLSFRLDLAKHSPSVGAPEIKLTAAWLFAGKTAMPDTSVGFVYENLSGLEAEARLDFPKLSLPFYFQGGLSKFYQDNGYTSPISRYTLGAGVKSREAGTFEAGLNVTYNPGLFYGGKIVLGSLSYSLPEKYGRASALAVTLTDFQIDGQSGLGGTLSFDLSRLIFGPIKRFGPGTDKELDQATPDPLDTNDQLK